MVYFGASRHEDERGAYEEMEVPQGAAVVQSGYAVSCRNTLRGLHCSPYGKIVVCQAGAMWDVVVDLRSDSETFLQWDMAMLSPERRTRMYVPPGVGHGYLSLADNTVTIYLKLGRFDKAKELEANVFDPVLAIPWPQPCGGARDYIMSAKDRSNPSVEDALARAAAEGRERPSRVWASMPAKL